MAETSLSAKPRHFISILDFDSQELKDLIALAIKIKSEFKGGAIRNSLLNRSLAMMFQKSSTRTRVSFETGMTQLGGHALFLQSSATQQGRGETIADTARVISSMVDAVMIRTADHAEVEEFAANSSVPVINGLTDLCHPCQLLADVMTFQEHRGSIEGAAVAYIGDGNNMCHSWLNTAVRFGFNVRVACPEGAEPLAEVMNFASDHCVIVRDPKEAAEGADLVVTDTWVSMGQEEEKEARIQLFSPFQVNSEVMALAKPDAVFMHCLPAYRGYEVTDEVLDGPQSIAWDEAENRLHAQKALLEFLILGLRN